MAFQRPEGERKAGQHLAGLWLFDRRCIKPDKANASALALLPKGSAHRLDRLWMLVRDTCPLPLLDHWRETVLELLQTRELLARLPASKSWPDRDRR